MDEYQDRQKSLAAFDLTFTLLLAHRTWLQTNLLASAASCKNRYYILADMNDVNRNRAKNREGKSILSYREKPIYFIPPISTFSA